MKYGIYYAYWETEWEADYTRYADRAARLGFDVLEIGAKPLPDYTKEQITALRRCAQESGIMLTAGYGPSYDHNMGSGDPAIRANATEWFKRLFEVMGELDIHTIGGALYSYWPIDFTKPVYKEEDWKHSVEGVRILSELAKPYDITLGMEVLNRFENHILNTAEEGICFVKEVDRENVKVMLDTFHMNIEETSIAEAIRSAGSLWDISIRESATVWFPVRDECPGVKSEKPCGIFIMMVWLSWNPSSIRADRLERIFISGAT